MLLEKKLQCRRFCYRILGRRYLVRRRRSSDVGVTNQDANLEHVDGYNLALLLRLSCHVAEIVVFLLY